MRRYSIEPKTRKYVKSYGFLSFARNLSNKYGKKLLDTGINTSKKLIHKATEAVSEFIRNKIADAVAKSYDYKIVKTKPVEEIIVPPEERKEILNELTILKMKYCKISELSNDSSVPKFVTKWIEANDLSSSQYSVNKSIRFKIWMLSSGLSDYRDAYIVVEDRITVEEDNDAETRNKKAIFRNNAPFRSCISKNNNTIIENAEDLGIVMVLL